MKLSRRGISVLVLSLTFLCVTAVWASKKKKADTGLDERQRAVHALNRLTFGARPGDVERVMQVGVDKWIDEQLHPEKIDDSALDARLSGLRTLTMSTEEMVTKFPPREFIKAVENGRINLPKYPAERAIFQAQIDRLDEKKQAKEALTD
jgi:hypothetical protein